MASAGMGRMTSVMMVIVELTVPAEIAGDETEHQADGNADEAGDETHL